MVVDEDTGTVLLLQDNDGDGSASGEEVQVLVDGSDPDTTFDDPNDAVLLADGSLLIADGGLDALLVVADLDDDGSATGDDEQELLFDDDGVLLSSPSGLAVAFAAETPPPAVIFLRGDTDTDGSLTLADAFGILRDRFEDAPHPCPAALDVNDDDIITLGDAIALLQYLYLEGPQPEPPFPTPGTDPTPETLGCAP